MITILVLLLIDHPSLERLGLRLPTAYGASIVLGIGAATVVILITVAILAGGQIPPNSVWPRLQSAWGYVIWAFLQEFILQSFFFHRCKQLYGGRAAVWIAATLFALAHLPNAPLTVAALVGALFFCEMFRRYPSIYPLGTVHAMLGLTLAIIAPDRLLHHMRVGIGYLRY
jgi:membrane protease YdiL (CAAX protease family)